MGGFRCRPLTSADVQAVNYISTQVGALKIYSGQLGNVNSAIQPSVLAFGDLQVEGGAFAINHNRSRVQQLLTGAIVRGEAAHHAEWKEEFNCLWTRSVGDVDHAAENNAIEIRILRKVIQHRPYQMGN